ncbi:MAG: hypothetical protein IJU03_01040 [Thermoguttaceae bacterium]|nr:hypothetical protein [Thermoguttaceae bacterium]
MNYIEQEKQEREKYVATARRYVENLEMFLSRVKRYIDDYAESEDGWVADCDGITPWIEFERLISDAIYLRQETWNHFERDNVEF